MSDAFPPCDLYAEDDKLAELRLAVDEFDRLYERCMTSVLSDEEQKQLNSLYERLTLMEQEYWADAGERIIFIIQMRMDTEFPMIRHTLGMLPNQNIKEKN